MPQGRDEDLYSFDDDQRKAFFDLQSIIKARELNHFTSSQTPSTSSQRTPRTRQQYSAETTAPNSDDSGHGQLNGFSSRSSSFPPLSGQTNSFTTRDVRSGLVGAEDDEPSFADFYDVDEYGQEDDEEYLD